MQPIQPPKSHQSAPRRPGVYHHPLSQTRHREKRVREPAIDGGTMLHPDRIRRPEGHRDGHGSVRRYRGGIPFLDEEEVWACQR